MAKLTREDVLKLAQLARISLEDSEIDEFSDELSQILQYVEQLSDVDVANLKPTNQVTGLTNVTRKDEIKSYGYDPLDLLKNVPSVEGNQLKVKKDDRVMVRQLVLNEGSVSPTAALRLTVFLSKRASVHGEVK